MEVLDDGRLGLPARMIPGRGPGDQAGATLVEIGVVLAVLGVLLSLGLPSLKGWKESMDLRNAAAEVSDVMLASRTKAIVERRTYTVSADETADTLAVAPAGRTDHLPGSVDLYIDNSDPDCLSLSSRNIDFRPNSTADAVGFEAVYLRSKSARVQVRYRIKVLGAAAKVSVERWLGGAWVGAY